MEHIVEVLQPHDDDISVMVPKVIDGLMQSLTGQSSFSCVPNSKCYSIRHCRFINTVICASEFYGLTANPQLKRQARVLSQLVKNLKKS